MSRLVRRSRELVCERLLRLLAGNGDRREPVGVLGRSVLELELARIWEQHVHDDALGRGEQDLVDELLVLVVAGVSTDQLHLRARQRHVEDARVRGVREVEAHHLAAPRFELQVGLAGDQHYVAEPAHRHVGRLLPECRDLSVLDQDVVERDQQLAVRRRPVARLAWDDEDVPVQAQLLAVVLADVRVVPVGAGVGHVHLVREALADRDRCLRVVGAVIAVLEPQAVPVNGGLEVAVVGDAHRRRRALGDLERRPRHRTVVRQHPHRRVADPLLDRDDLELELVPVGKLDQLGLAGLRKALGVARELDCRAVAFGAGSGIGYILSGSVPSSGCPALSRCAARLPRLRFLILGDPLCDVLGVVLHPADQRRAARVLPGEAEEVEARDIGDAAAVA